MNIKVKLIIALVAIVMLAGCVSQSPVDIQENVSVDDNITIDETQGEIINMTEFESELTVNDSTYTTTDDKVSAQYYNNSLLIEGNIVGNMGGMTIAEPEITEKDNTVYVDLHLDSENEIGTTAITGYKYELDLQIPDNIVNVEITHHGMEETTHTITPIDIMR